MKYAVVTGASSGIGWHITMGLAERGYSILAVSNQSKQLSDLKSALEEHYQVEVQTLALDLSETSAAENIYNYCRKNNIQVEVLVNNAGMLVYGEVTGAEPEQVSTILQLHMNTPAMLCRLFGVLMEQEQKGYILNVSSISAVMPYPTISLYGPTKTFLRKFTRALRFEMKGNGVNVTCLIPGATETALYDTKDMNVALAMRLGIMKRPGDVAKAGLKALFRNRAECIPGCLNKFVVRITPLVPACLIGYIYKRVKRREAKD